MKRQLLLRQLDETVDRLAQELGEAKRQPNQFKEEEKQRVPKWAKPNKVNWKIDLHDKWYPVSDGVIIDDVGTERYLKHGPSLWDLCYSDNPPEEKKAEPPLSEAEALVKAIRGLGSMRCVLFYDDQSGHVREGDHGKRLFSFSKFNEFISRAAGMKKS